MCECCKDFVVGVIGNNALGSLTASPVRLTIDRMISQLPVNHCFTLCIPTRLLRNASVNEVVITDGQNTRTCLNRCSDPLRYNSIVRLGQCRRACDYVTLRCSYRTEPNPGHIVVLSKVPCSTYSTPLNAAAANSAELEGEGTGEEQTATSRANAKKANA